MSPGRTREEWGGGGGGALEERRDEKAEPRRLSGSASMVARRIMRERPGRVLDCPCGEGWLARRLERDGFDVACADIDPAQAAAHGIECARVDLNRDELPFPEASFDFVACGGGLHRLHHVRHALDEFRRVLVPGGLLVVGTVNNGSLVRRLRFLLGGGVGRRLERLPSEHLGGAPEGNFRTALTCREISAALRAAGFDPERARPGRLSWRALALLPAGLAVWLSGMTLFRPGEPLGIILGGRHAVIAARKPV